MDGNIFIRLTLQIPCIQRYPWTSHYCNGSDEDSLLILLYPLSSLSTNYIFITLVQDAAQSSIWPFTHALNTRSKYGDHGEVLSYF